MFQGVGSKHASQYGKVAQDSHPRTSEHFEKRTVHISQEDEKTTIVAKSLVVDINQEKEVHHKKHKAKHGHHDASSVKIASVAKKRKFDGVQGVDKNIDDDQGSEAKKQKVHSSKESKIKDSKIAVDEHEKLRNLPFEEKRDRALKSCSDWGSKFMSTLSIWRPFEAADYAKLGYDFQSKLQATENWDSLIDVFEEHLKKFQEKKFSDNDQKKLVDELEPMLKKFKKEYGPKA